MSDVVAIYKASRIEPRRHLTDANAARLIAAAQPPSLVDDPAAPTVRWCFNDNQGVTSGGSYATCAEDFDQGCDIDDARVIRAAEGDQ